MSKNKLDIDVYMQPTVHLYLKRKEKPIKYEGDGSKIQLIQFITDNIK